jgi:enoyl-CoA hydratase
MGEVVTSELQPGGVMRITLNRPEVGNAQNVAMTYALNDAFMAAAHNPEVRVIVLAGEGKHFTTGHDLRASDHADVGSVYPMTSVWSDIAIDTAEGWYGWEREVYLDTCRRWRDIPKPTIAEVQGACIAGGLMLAWACDLIIASDDAKFGDPVVSIGANAVEYFLHVWEMGSRQAKEKLFTSDTWTAAEAHSWGMVNHVVPRAELESFTYELAKKIAAKPVFALKMAKESVNGALEAQGQSLAVDRAFALHQLCHANNRDLYGSLIDPNGLPETVRKDPDLSTLVVGDGRPDKRRSKAAN